MRTFFVWTLFLILPCALVLSRPLQMSEGGDSASRLSYDALNMPKQEDTSKSEPDQVISVRITSSVAVGRGRGKLSRVHENKHETPATHPHTSPVTENVSHAEISIHNEANDATTTGSPDLSGANIEYIKQLNSKKEARGLEHFERIHTFPSDIGIHHDYSNETNDSVAEPSSVLEVDSNIDEIDDNIKNVPLARSVPPSHSSKNYIQGLTHKPLSERGNNPRLTTVSFNILHDTAKVTSDYNEHSDTYVDPSRTVSEPTKFYEPPKFYNEPAKVYSQPAKVYSEPAKFYSEPAKVYSEPAKVYSEPAKVYSEPAKIYSEPAKFYSQPASLHLPPVPPNYTPWQQPSQSSVFSSTTITTTPVTTVTAPPMMQSTQRTEQQPEKNYEVDEKISVLTDGRSHGVQESTTESCKQENCKVGYVVEGRQYRKYRVEERTSDGFIVGEYGVVRHEDGALRGVRYTADGDASPRLIYDALMKFLQLK